MDNDVKAILAILVGILVLGVLFLFSTQLFIMPI